MKAARWTGPTEDNNKLQLTACISRWAKSQGYNVTLYDVSLEDSFSRFIIPSIRSSFNDPPFACNCRLLTVYLLRSNLSSRQYILFVLKFISFNVGFLIKLI